MQTSSKSNSMNVDKDNTRSRLLSQFNQLLSSLLIPVTIPTQSSKIPAKLLLKTFESLLEIRFDTLACPSTSTSTYVSSPFTSKSPGLSSVGKEEELTILVFLDTALKEVLGSSFELSKSKKSQSKEEIIIGGLIMIGLEMGLIKQPPIPSLSYNLTSTPFVSRDEDPFIFPSPKHTVFAEIINERVNSEAETIATKRSPSKSELRNRGLNYQLEKMRIQEEQEEAERFKTSGRGRELPLLIRPEARRVQSQQRKDKEEDFEEDFSTEGDSTPTPLVSSSRKAQKSRYRPTQSVIDNLQPYSPTTSNLPNDYAKGQSHSHFRPPSPPSLSDVYPSTSYLTSQSNNDHSSISHSHPRTSVTMKLSTTTNSKRKQFEESEWMNLIPSELEIQKFEESRRIASTSRSHKVGKKEEHQKSEGKENVLIEKRVEVVLGSENLKEGWEWTRVTGREVALRLEQEGREYELELEKKKVHLTKVLERLRKRPVAVER